MKENEMIFGIRAVIEAVQADKEIDKILSFSVICPFLPLDK